MPLLQQYPTTHEKLDKLAESLFDMLEKLRTSARAMADHQATMEMRIRLLEAGES
jgi:hypothetical protein